MLHLRELQVLRCVVLFIETERLWENWLITKTTFPPLDATCPARSWWAPLGHVTQGEVLE